MKQINVLALMILLTIVWLTLLATACSSEPPAPTTTPTPALPTPSGEEATGTPAAEISQMATLEALSAIVAQRTPMPTPTPGPVKKVVEDIASESGLAGTRVLGLKTVDWINLGLSAVLVVVGSLLVIPLLFSVLRWAVRRTRTQFDSDFLATIGRELRWLVVIILARLAVLRLDFWSDQLRILIDDLFFLLTLAVLYVVALHLVTFAADWYLDRLKSKADRKQLGPIVTTLKRLGYIFVSLIGLSITSSHFGINLTLPSAVIVFVAVVIALAGKEAIADAVSGFLILIDQPFRVGDDIYIEDLKTWGDVVEIGLRSTRLHTADNRQVIIPNSLIAQSQAVNYSDPDPDLRVQTDVSVAYGVDLNQVERVIVEAVRGVEGVLPDKPVEVWYRQFGDWARRIRVLWWINDVNHADPIRNHVNRAIELALSEAGIECPLPTYNLNLGPEAEKGSRTTQAL
jgi:small-conductance mechanosensitive channel